MRRLALLFALLTVPISSLCVALAGPAAAAAGVTTSCSKLTGSLTAPKVTLSKCNDTANTGGRGTIPTSSIEAGAGTITWNGTGKTKVDDITIAATSTNACPKGSTEEEVTGNVTGGTGAAVTSIKKGYSLQAFVCANSSTASISLAPGTKVNFGKKF
jgi:hypothetical protein